MICGSIYVLGHLGPLIVNSAAGKLVFIKFIGQFDLGVVPVLDHYEIEGAIAGSSIVPAEYLMTALLYSFSTAQRRCSGAVLLRRPRLGVKPIFFSEPAAANAEKMPTANPLCDG